MTGQPFAPTKHRLGAVMSGTLPHDMLNMHFYGVFRKVELDGDQLIGKAELQRREHVLLAGRKVDHRFLGRKVGGAGTLVDYGWPGIAGVGRYRLEVRRLVLYNNREWSVGPT